MAIYAIIVVVALEFFFLRWSLRNLNYTKYNKKRTWIYQHHTHTKKKKKNKFYNFFSTNKIKKQKDIDEKLSENWKCWNESIKVRESEMMIEKKKIQKVRESNEWYMLQLRAKLLRILTTTISFLVLFFRTIKLGII